MNVLNYINTGSGRGFHGAMKAFAIAKFGEIESKDMIQYGPTNDDYANKLLSIFTGISVNRGLLTVRLFLRVVASQELGNYLLTGEKTEGFLSKYNATDRIYWCNASTEIIKKGRLLTA